MLLTSSLPLHLNMLFTIYISATSWRSKQEEGIIFPGSAQLLVGNPHPLGHIAIANTALPDNADPGNPTPPRARTRIPKLCDGLLPLCVKQCFGLHCTNNFYLPIQENDKDYGSLEISTEDSFRSKLIIVVLRTVFLSTFVI